MRTYLVSDRACTVMVSYQIEAIAAHRDGIHDAHGFAIDATMSRQISVLLRFACSIHFVLSPTTSEGS